jgi:hypothetical protein
MWHQDESGRIHTPFEPVVLAATLGIVGGSNGQALKKILTVGSPKFSIRELSVDLSANSLSADANADGDDRGTAIAGAIAGCLRFGHSPCRRS